MDAKRIGNVCDGIATTRQLEKKKAPDLFAAIPVQSRQDNGRIGLSTTQRAEKMTWAHD
jgi:hypothetical protein